MRPNTTTSSTNAQFAKGFAAALATLFVLGTGLSIAKWFIGHPFVARLQHALTMPLFSILDIVSFVVFLVILFAVVWMLAFGPRRF